MNSTFEQRRGVEPRMYVRENPQGKTDILTMQFRGLHVTNRVPTGFARQFYHHAATFREALPELTPLVLTAEDAWRGWKRSFAFEMRLGSQSHVVVIDAFNPCSDSKSVHVYDDWQRYVAHLDAPKELSDEASEALADAMRRLCGPDPPPYVPLKGPLLESISYGPEDLFGCVFFDRGTSPNEEAFIAEVGGRCAGLEQSVPLARGGGGRRPATLSEARVVEAALAVAPAVCRRAAEGPVPADHALPYEFEPFSLTTSFLSGFTAGRSAKKKRVEVVCAFPCAGAVRSERLPKPEQAMPVLRHLVARRPASCSLADAVAHHAAAAAALEPGTRDWRLETYALALCHFDHNTAAGLARYVELSDAILDCDPSDEIGVRYHLLDALLTQGNLPAAMRLLERFPEDTTEWWAWTKVYFLLVTQKKGASSKKVKRALEDAIKRNPFVFPLLVGDAGAIEDGAMLNAISMTINGEYAYGTEGTARCYLDAFVKHWVGGKIGGPELVSAVRAVGADASSRWRATYRIEAPRFSSAARGGATPLDTGEDATKASNDSLGAAYGGQAGLFSGLNASAEARQKQFEAMQNLAPGFDAASASVTIAPLRADLMVCATCGKLKSKACPLKLCARCSAVAYCSTACQRQGWKQHKKACVAPIRE